MDLSWSQLLAYVESHYLIRAVLIAVFCLLFAWVFDLLVRFLVSRYAVPAEDGVHVAMLRLIHRPLYYTIFLVGLVVLLPLLGLNQAAARVGQSVSFSLIILIWARVVIKAYGHIIVMRFRHKKTGSLINLQTKPLFDGLLKVVTIVLAVYFVLLCWDVEPTGWVASLGVGGLVLGIAAKDSLGNIFSGMFLLADAPYVKGDYVVLPTGERGYINTIGLRATRIMTRDDIEIIMPNSIMANSKIINESGGGSTAERIRVDIGVGYDSDIDKVENVLTQIALNHPLVCQSPSPRVRFRKFADSALDLQLMFWIEQPANRGLVTHEVNKAILLAFREHGIDIPYPQLTLHKTQPV